MSSYKHLTAKDHPQPASYHSHHQHTQRAISSVYHSKALPYQKDAPAHKSDHHIHQILKDQQPLLRDSPACEPAVEAYN